jgi:TetR/AcrR family transcriptional regulator, transcriptional repressor for nem operon
VSQTTTQLLDEAQRLVQLRGFNAFSYADLAQAVGISKPSIHYHFPAKQDLALELIRRYRRNLADGLAWVDSSSSETSTRLKMYVQYFAGLVHDQKLCLCAALAADAGTLSEPVRFEVAQALAQKTTWLAQMMPEQTAKRFVATVEGAMLLARANQDPSLYDSVCAALLKTV